MSAGAYDEYWHRKLTANGEEEEGRDERKVIDEMGQDGGTDAVING